MVGVSEFWILDETMMLLIVTAGYTEASKIQTTGPIRLKFKRQLSIMLTIKIYGVNIMNQQ